MRHPPAVTVAVPGACGELIQGWHAGWDEAVLVSCPITLCSRVSVTPCPGPDIRTAHNQRDYTKSRQAARLMLDHLSRPELGAELHVSSRLRPGRGMASSTADVVGVLAGLAAALDARLSPGELARLACQIEPSDSTMFDGLTLLAYRGSGRYRPLGSPPSLPLLMLDTGQTVDTLSYNARLDLAAVRQLAHTTQAAIDLLIEGIAGHDAAAIGAAATLSARSYQVINYSPLVEQAQQWAGGNRGAGAGTRSQRQRAGPAVPGSHQPGGTGPLVVDPVPRPDPTNATGRRGLFGQRSAGHSRCECANVRMCEWRIMNGEWRNESSFATLLESYFTQ